MTTIPATMAASLGFTAQRAVWLKLTVEAFPRLSVVAAVRDELRRDGTFTAERVAAAARHRAGRGDVALLQGHERHERLPRGARRHTAHGGPIEQWVTGCRRHSAPFIRTHFG